MPQQRDPFVSEVVEAIRAAPDNLLIEPRAAQPTRAGGGVQAVKHIERVSLMNAAGSGGLVDIGLMRGSHIHWIWTLTLTTAGVWYWAHLEITTLSDYQVVARFRISEQNGGAHLNDPVHMNVHGYYLEPYTSP